MAAPDRELELSPLSDRVTRDGVTVQVHIYRFAGTDEEGKTLKVVDHEDGSTVWDGSFDTDVVTPRTSHKDGTPPPCDAPHPVRSHHE